jgi:Holliday junction resolvase-like predicted endonuclease
MRWNEKHSFRTFEERLPPLPRSRIKEFERMFPGFCSAYGAKFGRDRLTRVMLPLLEEALTNYPPKNFQKGYVGESIAAALVSLFMDEKEILLRNIQFRFNEGCGEIDLIIFNGPFISAVGEVKTGVNGQHRKNLSKARNHLREALGVRMDEEEVKLLSKISLSVAKIETLENISSIRINDHIEIYFLQSVRFFSVGPWDAHPENQPTFKMPVHSEGIGILSKDMRKEEKKHRGNNHNKNR